MLIQTLDKAEILAAYLNWFIDNVPNEDELHYDVLECTTKFSINPEILKQFTDKLTKMKEKYEVDKGINIEYFKEIGLRIEEKITDKNKPQ